MAATESSSSCGPQANAHPPPPSAQAPKPTGVMSRSELPSRPDAVAAEVPVADEHGHRPPRLPPRQRRAGQVPRHLRVGVDGGVSVEVGRRERPQDQPLRLQADHDPPPTPATALPTPPPDP